MQWDWPQFVTLIVPIVLGGLAGQAGALFNTWRTAKGDDASRLFKMSTDLLEEHRRETNRLREEMAGIRARSDECETEREELRADVRQMRRDLTRMQDSVRKGRGGEANLGSG